MKMTPEEIWADLVSTNLLHISVVVNRAEKANKGCFCHDINKLMSELKPLYQKISQLNPQNVKKDEFDRSCQLTQSIGYRLYLLNSYKEENGQVPEMLKDCKLRTIKCESNESNESNESKRLSQKTNGKP